MVGVQIGAALASSWHLPSGFAMAIGAQLMPALAGPHVTEAALLHLANQILATDEAENPDEAALQRQTRAQSPRARHRS